MSTHERILEVAMASFGTRGFEATSLDALASELGITKQTILYWFPSKVALLDSVIEHGATELAAALEVAVSGSDPGMARMQAVMDTVFRFAVRRPALLGLLREVGRLGPEVAGDLAERMSPLVERAVSMLEREMDAGVIRRTDPRVLLLLVYATVVGVATEVEAQRAVGLPATRATLRRLRRELFAFVRAAMLPPPGSA
ncbi:MAG TPA: TetR/AcrR family transcriptional regulator [Acidimicrobiales bacterium]